jgi:hypothetical protein
LKKKEIKKYSFASNLPLLIPGSYKTFQQCFSGIASGFPVCCRQFAAILQIADQQQLCLLEGNFPEVGIRPKTYSQAERERSKAPIICRSIKSSALAGRRQEFPRLLHCILGFLSSKITAAVLLFLPHPAFPAMKP